MISLGFTEIKKAFQYLSAQYPQKGGMALDVWSLISSYKYAVCNLLERGSTLWLEAFILWLSNIDFYKIL